MAGGRREAKGGRGEMGRGSGGAKGKEEGKQGWKMGRQSGQGLIRKGKRRHTEKEEKADRDQRLPKGKHLPDVRQLITDAASVL